MGLREYRQKIVQYLITSQLTDGLWASIISASLTRPLRGQEGAPMPESFYPGLRWCMPVRAGSCAGGWTRRDRTCRKPRSEWTIESSHIDSQRSDGHCAPPDHQETDRNVVTSLGSGINMTGRAGMRRGSHTCVGRLPRYADHTTGSRFLVKEIRWAPAHPPTGGFYA